jgi:hypothetical protein
MATKKISELTLLDTVSANLELTVIPVLDTASGTTRKVTLQQINDSVEANIPFAAAAFTQANNANIDAISSGLYANAAFIKANSALNVSTGGTITGDLTITGNVSITGCTATLSVSTFRTSDHIIDVGFGTTGVASQNAGIRVLRGDENPVQLRWNESSDKWQFTNDGTEYVDFSDVTSSQLSSAYNQANTANTNAITSGVYANSAFEKSNNSLNVSTGGSITGNIVVNGNVTANYFLGNGSLLTDISNSFDLEMHVSKDGNDSTGTGTILRPYLTITHALTQVTGGRNTIVIHPGAYTENPTITSLATQLITYDATGASTLIYGTVTIANTTGRIAGLKMTNLAITGNAQAYINSSTVDEQFTKSSSGYVEVDDCELQTTGNVLISGSGITTIIGNKINNLVVNNAGAQVLIKGANDCLMPQVTAGSLNIVDSTIRASSNTANAVTAGAGTVVTLMNNQIVTPASDTVARVSIAGYHSIISVVYDKANSTLSNSLNSVTYFQTVNVDSLVISGNVTGGNISTTGNVTAAYFIGNGSLLTGISAGDYANAAYVAANTSDQKAVSAGNYANSAYGQANTASLYTASNSAYWLTSSPTTIQAAVDRLANLVFTLNSNNPIP